MDLITGLGVLTRTAYHMPDYMRSCGMMGKVLMVAFGIFWVIMLINCLQRKFKVSTDKIAWILVLVFLPVLGAFIYLFWLYFGLRKKK
tara:strand:+ start:614 stop:877 length:264 start_codon:yes stop_codon:yes gene_type:complete